jgi:hypothetical protein
MNDMLAIYKKHSHTLVLIRVGAAYWSINHCVDSIKNVETKRNEITAALIASICRTERHQQND